MNMTSQNIQDLNLKDIPFNLEWENGTGYFDHAMTDKTVKVPSISRDQHDRQILLIPLKNGKNLVVFQRFTDDLDIWTCNCPLPGPLFSTKCSPVELVLLRKLAKGETTLEASEVEAFRLLFLGDIARPVEEVFYARRLRELRTQLENLGLTLP